MTEVPYFYFPLLKDATGSVNMDEEMKRHVVTVLRMQVGEKIMLMDGRGHVAEASIESGDKKLLRVSIGTKTFYPPPATKTILAISILKNPSRFEWMLEKVTEIGITDIIPMITDRTERMHFREERMQQIVISASIQSKQMWMPVLHAPQKFNGIIDQVHAEKKFIAHCIDGKKQLLQKQESDALLLVGPEGDFTPDEIGYAMNAGFVPTTLGDSRLRSETAGIVGAVLMKI